MTEQHLSSASQRRAGKHLLPLAYFDRKVTVNMKPADPNSTHLYPKLLGVDWDCYITGTKVLLGRTVDRTSKGQKGRQEDLIELGTDQMISRRHAVIQLNDTKLRWELKAYGMNGVEVNRKLVTSKSPPVELTPGALIKIVHQEFLFVPASGSTADVHSQELATPELTTDKSLDIQTARTTRKLEETVISVLRSHGGDGLSTAEIAVRTLKCQQEEHGEGTATDCSKATVLETLVNSVKCELTEDSIDLTETESDSARWILAPQYDSYDGLPWRNPVPSVGVSIEAIYSMWQGVEELTSQRDDARDGVSLWRDARSLELLERSSSQSTIQL